MKYSFLSVSIEGDDVAPEERGNKVRELVLAAIGITARSPNPVVHTGQSDEWNFELDQDFSHRHAKSNKGKGRAGFAILTGGVQQRLEDHLLKTFQEIDTENKGVINHEDLRSYAEKNGMPTDYVDQFVSAVMASSGAPARFFKRGLGFDHFRNYVSSRESALQRAFNLFDLDGDGKITATDLELSLNHVRVSCPYSRCVYQSRRQCVRDLVAKVDVDGNKTVEFWEFRKFFMLLPQEHMAVDYWLSAKCSSRCDVGGCVVMHDEKSKGSPWGHLFAGAMAGAASRTATAPLETLRLSAMTGVIPGNLNALAAAKTVMKDQGWKALYKGNLTNVIRSAPQKALDFFAFDAFKALLGGRGAPGFVHTFSAAGMAGATSNFLLYPLEVVRSRLTVDCSGTYKGLGHAFRKIVRTEGAGALYKGVGPSVAAILPEAAIVYGLFDLLKSSYSRITGNDPGVGQSLSFGVFSAFMGQLVAYPLETVSRRMQVCGLQNPSVKQDFVSAFGQVVSEGGPRALYRGVGAATLRVIPMAVVSFGTYEMVRLWVNQIEEQMDSLKARQERDLCGNRVELMDEGGEL